MFYLRQRCQGSHNPAHQSSRSASRYSGHTEQTLSAHTLLGETILLIPPEHCLQQLEKKSSEMPGYNNMILFITTSQWDLHVGDKLVNLSISIYIFICVRQNSVSFSAKFFIYPMKMYFIDLPLVHEQLGSPSSSPLDFPSPSESALHKSLVQLYNTITINRPTLPSYTKLSNRSLFSLYSSQ